MRSATIRWWKAGGLALFVAAGTGQVWAAASCNPVARLILPEGRGATSVTVERYNSGASSKSLAPTELCAGDTVKWPAGVTAGIRYQQNPPTVKEYAGPVEIPIIDIPEQRTVSNVWALMDSWVLRVAPSKPAVTRTHRKMFSPLSRGEPEDSPFFLLSDTKSVRFFWVGGQPPWNVRITDAAGRALLDSSVTTPDVAFTLPPHEHGTRLQMSITSWDKRVLEKAIVVEDGARLGFRATGDAWTRVFQLLMQDSDKNWRLDIWSAISDLPDGFAKAQIMDHLVKEDR